MNAKLINCILIFLVIINVINSQNVLIKMDTTNFNSKTCVTLTNSLLNDSTSTPLYSQLICYYSNGHVESEYYSFWTNDICPNNKIGFQISGTFRSFYENTNIKAIGSFHLGHQYGLSVTYFQNGQIESIGYYKLPDDLCFYEYTTDTIVSQLEFEESISLIIKILSYKTGEWKYYLPSGELERTEYY